MNIVLSKKNRKKGVQKKAVITKVRVLYSDVDQMRWANHGAYHRWFEMGRAEYMRQKGLPYKELEEMGYFMPVTELYCKFLKPVRYDDLLEVAAWPSIVKRASMRFEYEIIKDGEVMAKGYTHHVCLNREGKIVRIPERLRKILKVQE